MAGAIDRKLSIFLRWLWIPWCLKLRPQYSHLAHTHHTHKRKLNTYTHTHTHTHTHTQPIEAATDATEQGKSHIGAEDCFEGGYAGEKGGLGVCMSICLCVWYFCLYVCVCYFFCVFIMSYNPSFLKFKT